MKTAGSRFTGVGTVLLLAVVVVATAPPRTADRQIVAVLWSAAVAALVVGTVWPLLAARRVRVELAAPRDGAVGRDLRVSLRISGAGLPVRARLLDPPSPWTVAADGREVDLAWRPGRRGVHPNLVVEVATSAPLGVFTARRLHVVAPAHPVEVAPRALEVTWHEVHAPVEGVVVPAPQVSTGGDLVRSVRPYRSGDPAHLVHWPSSARRGDLVVREMEPPAPTGMALVLDLRDLAEDRERAASYAAGAARAVLEAGGALVLCTAEAGGPVTATVPSVLDAGRRLARAVDGEPGAAPAGWRVVEIGRTAPATSPLAPIVGGPS